MRGDVTGPADFLLPQTVRDVAEVIGRRQAFILAGAVCPPATAERRSDRGRSGCIYVPIALTTGRNERLVEILGHDDAKRIVDAFGGMILHFPCCEAFARYYRDRAIQRMAADGWNRKAVAWMFGVSERTVRNVTTRC